MAFDPKTGWVKPAFAKITKPLYTLIRTPAQSISFSTFFGGGLVTVEGGTGRLVRLVKPPTEHTLVVAHFAQALTNSTLAPELIKKISEADLAHQGEPFIGLLTHSQTDVATTLAACNEVFLRFTQEGPEPTGCVDVFDRSKSLAEEVNISDMVKAGFMKKMGRYGSSTKEEMEARREKAAKTCVYTHNPRPPRPRLTRPASPPALGRWAAKPQSEKDATWTKTERT